MGILDEDVQRVREATDLVELVREHVAPAPSRPTLHRPVPVPPGEVAELLGQPRDGRVSLPRRRDPRHHLGRRQADP